MTGPLRPTLRSPEGLRVAAQRTEEGGPQGACWEISLALRTLLTPPWGDMWPERAEKCVLRAT